MKLKSTKTDSPLISRLKRFRRLPGIIRWTLLVIIASVFILSIIIASMRYGMELYKFGDARNIAELFRHIGKTKLQIIPNYINGLTAQPPHLKIDVKFSNLQKLRYDRAKALERQIILSDSLSLINATLSYGDEVLPAKMRLKGDWTFDNLQGDKWSFRFRLRGDNTIFGMKQFSLHHPRVRNYVYEWLFHKMLDKEDIISLRYKFVQLSLNGKNLGVYAIEEHFEKRLIEHNRNREGPILKLDEDPRWKAIGKSWPQKSPLGLSSMYSASVDVFKKGTVTQDTVLYQQFLLAASLFERFRTGELKASDVFDAKKMASYFAVVDLMGALHALSWHNLRFYYNPISSRLEPIGFDGNAGTRTVYLNGLRKGAGLETNPFQDLILEDEVIFKEYVACLERMAVPDYLTDFLAEVDEELNKNLEIIHSDYPDFYYSDDILYKNQETIRYSLDPVKGLHAYPDNIDDNRVTLLLGNIQAWPIEIHALSFPDGRLIEPESPLILETHNPSVPVAFEPITFRLSGGIEVNDSLRANLAVQYSIFGSNVRKTVGVFTWPLIDEFVVKDDFLRQTPNINKFDFFDIDESAKIINILPGEWKVFSDVIIPSGYTVYCNEGTVLSLEKSSKILSYSPFNFYGKKDAKIVVRSNDSTGQGLAVFETDAKSHLKHVIFENLSNSAKGSWSIPGAITFYKADVLFEACVFRSNRSEDFVNVIRADFSLEDCLFTNVSSDAFDGDFCGGQIANVAFVDIGNDALDVSGSSIEVFGMSVSGAGDKGISVGENSVVTAKDVEIKDSEIGIAVKDLSRLELIGLDITNSKVGFVLFQKKPEFGQAIAGIQQFTSQNIEVIYLVEKGSELTLNGQIVDKYQDDVESMLYGIVYGKSSHGSKDDSIR